MSWQKILAQGFSTAKELLHFLELPEQTGSELAEQQFTTRVPLGFARRMVPGNAQDPLLLQVLASGHELERHNDYRVDPLGEAKTNLMQGLIHKYRGRVLLTLTGACAVNCRYCFRRHFPYENNNPGRDGWEPTLDYIRRDTSIHEVILSGGDPLLAPDPLWSDLCGRLIEMDQLRTLRIHTRIPVVLPERINHSFLTLLTDIPLRKVVVLHCNHAQEIDAQVQDACAALRHAGCHLLNQTVLLKDVNDSAVVLAELSEALFDCGVLPYYLHVLDKVAGAAHFDIPTATALALHRQVQEILPGYLVPRLVREEAGKRCKTLLI